MTKISNCIRVFQFTLNSIKRFCKSHQSPIMSFHNVGFVNCAMSPSQYVARQPGQCRVTQSAFAPFPRHSITSQSLVLNHWNSCYSVSFRINGSKDSFRIHKGQSFFIKIIFVCMSRNNFDNWYRNITSHPIFLPSFSSHGLILYQSLSLCPCLLDMLKNGIA